MRDRLELDGYVKIPKHPTVKILEKFTGRGLMCGSSPHPEVYQDALRKYNRFIEFIIESDKDRK